MKDTIIHLFEQSPTLAALLSILIGILIALLGLVPSFFLTAANILFFGFWKGTALSFAGEALGAVLAFLLYRYGFRSNLKTSLTKYPRLGQLLEAKQTRAGWLVFSLRLMPFMPSGLVTFAAAISSMQLLHFFIFSSLGKIPALLMEAYSVNEITQFSWQGKLILVIISLASIYLLVRKKNKRS